MAFNSIFINEELMVMFLLIKKEKKNIAVMINASTSSGNFYFGHFVEAEDISQSCMLSISYN